MADSLPNIKEYEGKTKKEAMLKATMENGANYNILGFQEVQKGGVFGIGAKKYWNMRIIVSGKKSYDLKDKVKKDKGEISKHKSLSAEEIGENISRISSSIRRSELASVNNLSVSAPQKEESRTNVDDRIDKLEDTLKVMMELMKQRNAESAPSAPKEEEPRPAQNYEQQTNISDKIIDDGYFDPAFQEKINPVESKSMATKPISLNDSAAEVSNSDTYSKKDLFAKKEDNFSEMVDSMKEDKVNITSSNESEKDFEKNEIFKPKEMKPQKAQSENVIDAHIKELGKREFPYEMLEELRYHLNHNSNARFFQDEKVVKESVISYFNERLITKKGIALTGQKKKVVMLVGATGVGKTTTIPKLAALFKESKRDFRFYTIDCYRLAAEEQLKRYAEILRTPFMVVKSPELFREEVLKVKGNSILFVDTIGRSPKNIEEIEKMSKYLENAGKVDLEIQLVLSATTKYQDALEILESFKRLKYQGVIISKIDETDYVAPALSAVMKSEVPVTYFTFGQCVPLDIKDASQSKKDIINKIYGD